MRNTSWSQQPSTSQPLTQLLRSTNPLDTISHQVHRNDNNKHEQSTNKHISPNASDSNVNSVINISNSNDVVIGPMMQYHGEVTIYQYMDTKVADPLRPKALELGSMVTLNSKLNLFFNNVFSYTI